MLLQGQKALVTGGSRGIGRGIVTRLLREGATVYYIASKAGEFLDEYQKIAKEHGVEVFFKEGNVADEETITATVQEILEESGGIDILVNNAGITRDGLIFRMSEKDWNDVISVNLTGAFHTCRAVSRSMIKRRSGSIVNITSIVGLVGNGGQTNYSASKAGLIGLTKSLARETASRNVRVNAIAPGYIQTDMTESLNENQRESLIAQIPMARIGTPDEVARVVVFLASDLGAYVTGQVVHVTGGLGM
ncbi:MAG: 3-oxoacyl-[acyl-carrier-protein] reductase [bacterium]